MVTISCVDGSSLLLTEGVKPLDKLVSINGNSINDVLDYRFYMTEKKLCIVFEREGRQFEVKIKKNIYDDLGLEFETYLMDKKRSCRNNCIFCFIDQNPKGMRESIYFKDDDERLSFLQGSYITLTNLSDCDIDRIIKMKISPVNVSVHSMNPDLRVMLTGNRFAGKSLKKLYRLAENGTGLNLQFVLCKGINDGKELEYSLEEISKLTSLISASIVPCGLTSHRQGLYPLVPFDKQSAGDVIDITERFNKRFKEKDGMGRVFCSDEFYLLAQRELPKSDYYEGFPQYDNGVGMLTDMEESFMSALADTDTSVSGEISIATGYAAYPLMEKLAHEFENRFPQRKINVYKIKNDFFGESVTVSGLITGSDYEKQLKGKVKSRLLLSRSSLNASGELFLDGMTPQKLEEALGVTIEYVTSDGYELCEKIANGR